MTPIITVFANSPDGGRGLARDMRVRWALEEAGQPYEVRTQTFAELKQVDHRRRQPFGQIPTYEEDGLVLFESGAIVLHIAQKHPGLLPADPIARARAISWLFAALNTAEPPIVEREQVSLSERDKPWYSDERLDFLEERIRVRLRDLSFRLDGAEWLDGAFSVGDLMMIEVLRRLEGSAIIGEFPALVAYIERGRARPAFQRAFAAQLELFRSSSAA